MKASAHSVGLALLAVLGTGCDAGPLGPTARTLAESRAAVGSAQPVSFNLIGPNTALDPATGDIIRTTGSGSFDPAAGTIVASGSFTHIKADGTVFARGTWAATTFDNFVAFGGPNPGTQGGVLELTVTLFPNGGSPVTGVPMSVTCLVNAPSSFTEEEGTTVGTFTEKTGGQTLFHGN